MTLPLAAASWIAPLKLSRITSKLRPMATPPRPREMRWRWWWTRLRRQAGAATLRRVGDWCSTMWVARTGAHRLVCVKALPCCAWIKTKRKGTRRRGESPQAGQTRVVPSVLLLGLLASIASSLCEIPGLPKFQESVQICSCLYIPTILFKRSEGPFCRMTKHVFFAIVWVVQSEVATLSLRYTRRYVCLYVDIHTHTHIHTHSHTHILICGCVDDVWSLKSCVFV